MRVFYQQPTSSEKHHSSRKWRRRFERQRRIRSILAELERLAYVVFVLFALQVALRFDTFIMASYADWSRLHTVKSSYNLYLPYAANADRHKHWAYGLRVVITANNKIVYMSYYFDEINPAKDLNSDLKWWIEYEDPVFIIADRNAKMATVMAVQQKLRHMGARKFFYKTTSFDSRGQQK
jgi:biopolymer transport protein ExbD